MAVTIQILRSTDDAAPASPAYGELSYSFHTNRKKLYIGDSGNSNITIGGQYFTDIIDNRLPLETTTVGSKLKLLEGTNNGTNYITIGSPAAITTSVDYVFPEDGSSGYVLQTAGNGTLSWVEQSGGTPTDITVADESTDTTCFPLFVTDATGDLGPKTGTNLTFDSATGLLTATGLSGNLTGTLQTAAQGNVTSLGTLTTLVVDNVTIDTNTISTTDTNGDLILSPHGSGDVDVGTSKIINVTDPASAQDAATKAYVDATASGLDVKESVRVATTAAGTLASDFENGDTVDAITLATDDRILIKDQATGSENGIYTVNGSGAPTRATDYDSTAEVTTGAFTFVEVGTTNASTGWVLSTTGTITLDSTALTFTQFSGAGLITAGAGLTKTGNTIDIVGTADKITVNADDITIASTYVGQSSITTLGTITTGTWTADTVGVGYGGTGIASAAKGSVLIANAVDTISALDGGGSNDGILAYTASSDDIAWSTSVDGGTF